jgi:hypothetical protein
MNYFDFREIGRRSRFTSVRNKVLTYYKRPSELVQYYEASIALTPKPEYLLQQFRQTVSSSLDRTVSVRGANERRRWSFVSGKDARMLKHTGGISSFVTRLSAVNRPKHDRHARKEQSSRSLSFSDSRVKQSTDERAGRFGHEQDIFSELLRLLEESN